MPTLQHSRAGLREPVKGFFDYLSVDIFVCHSDGFRHVEGMISSFYSVNFPGSGKFFQHRFKPAQIAESVARSREEEHGNLDPVEMCIAKFFFVVSGVKRVSEEYKSIHP